MRNGEPGWFASLLGAAVLIAGGFALGLVAGVVSEEPDLVVGHLVGRSDEVEWVPEGEAEFTIAREEAELPREAPPLDGGALADAPRDALAGDADAAAEEVEMAPELPPRETKLPAVAAAPPRRPSREVAGSAASREAVDGSGARSGFAVQVGAFSDGGSAENVRQKLRGNGFDSYVVPASVSGDGKWRVRVGPVATREAAESLAGRLKSEERLPTWVLSEGGG